MSVGEMQFQRFAIHQRHKISRRTSNGAGDDNRSIGARGEHQAIEQRAQAEVIARNEACGTGTERNLIEIVANMAFVAAMENVT